MDPNYLIRWMVIDRNDFGIQQRQQQRRQHRRQQQQRWQALYGDYRGGNKPIWMIGYFAGGTTAGAAAGH
jgi:hypothetical protein